ncbi:hypothetical protein ABT095_21015 [Kitasatospora sp. NPDC002227]|uniref:hypothetical protein n=1 Tax=Kitasatospora sp. NPDC002227 TaxID=3154773 RepID=UPI00332B0EF4
MLRTLWRLGTATALAIGLAVALVPAASADPTPAPSGTVTDCANQYICIVVTEPGSDPSPGGGGTGTGTGGGGVQMCEWNGKQWPCSDKDLGWFDTDDGCYYRQSEPLPLPGAPEWEGHDPSAGGSVYDINCPQTGGGFTSRGPKFLPQPPKGTPPTHTVYEAAKSVADEMGVEQPVLHAAPADAAVVGAPVWLWFDRTTGTGGDTGTETKTVSRWGYSITAVATITGVHWNLGKKSESVDCTGAGTPFGHGATHSDCTYTYRQSSALEPNTSYYLTATITWRVTAHLAGSTADLITPFPKSASSLNPLPLRVGEVQVLNN